MKIGVIGLGKLGCSMFAAFAASEEGQAMRASFDEVATCQDPQPWDLSMRFDWSAQAPQRQYAAPLQFQTLRMLPSPTPQILD